MPRQTAQIKIDNVKVMSYDQELIIVNKILEIRDIVQCAQELKLPQSTISQVLWKYKDIISNVILNRDLADKVVHNYEENLDIMLDASNKAIRLLSRQIDIFYQEYMDERNKDVAMKDYLITQVLSIQDKLQAMIDRNEAQYKDYTKILDERIKGFKKIQVDSENQIDVYLTNNSTVADKLRKFTNPEAFNDGRGFSSMRWTFDLCDKDGTFMKHYNSCQDMARDGYGSKTALQRFIKKNAGSDIKEVPFKTTSGEEYIIKNIKKEV